MRKIRLSQTASRFIAKHSVKDITIDLENFGECCIGIAEAVVTIGTPDDQTQYDYYRSGDLGVFVFKPIQFMGKEVKIDLSKVLFMKPRLIAGDVKLL